MMAGVFVFKRTLFNILPLPEFNLNRFQFAFKPAKLLIQALNPLFGTLLALSVLGEEVGHLIMSACHNTHV